MSVHEARDDVATIEVDHGVAGKPSLLTPHRGDALTLDHHVSSNAGEVAADVEGRIAQYQASHHHS